MVEKQSDLNTSIVMHLDGEGKVKVVLQVRNHRMSVVHQGPGALGVK